MFARKNDSLNQSLCETNKAILDMIKEQLNAKDKLKYPDNSTDTFFPQYLETSEMRTDPRNTIDTLSVLQMRSVLKNLIPVVLAKWRRTTTWRGETEVLQS